MRRAVPRRLPLTTQRLIVITGKGGVGKTTVTAAFAQAAAAARRRVLAVEVGRGRLSALLGAATVTHEPTRIGPRLAVARLEPEAVLGDFVLSALRIRLLARRLLESTTFQVLAAAAPGLPELLVLHRVVGWLEERRLGRPAYDLVLLDAPASGHSLPLLAAPRTLGALARFGPVATLLRSMERVLHEPATTLVCLVATPEELAVRETLELHRELSVGLGLSVGPPILNAVPRRRFTPSDVTALAGLDPDDPHVVAARFHLERRRQAQVQYTTLRRSLGVTPVRLPLLFPPPETSGGIDTLAGELARAAGLAA
jgi:hypothetical protein